MNVWKLTAAGNLVCTEEELRPEEGKRRVRITKVFLNGEDAAIAKGERKVKYPLVPGRYAVGRLADEGGNALFPKNARVLLHSYLPAEDSGAEKRSFDEDDFRLAGRTSDGFLRDFVYAAEDEMTLLPDAVNDEKALLLYYVALAEATVDTLGVKRGEHIAVIGANLIGLFVSRLLIYRQAAPILIDPDKEKLEFAKSRGVYYTSLPGEELMELVGTVTGGRLADGAVFVASAGINDPSLPVRVCGAGRHIAVCGAGGELSLDLGGVTRKRLTVHGVPDGTEELETAINLIANKAVDLSAFHYVTHGADEIKEVLQGWDGHPHGVNDVCLIGLL